MSSVVLLSLQRIGANALRRQLLRAVAWPICASVVLVDPDANSWVISESFKDTN